MTRDDVIRLRDEADEWAERHLCCTGEYHPDFSVVRDERFAALVAAAERERAIEISKGMQEELQAKFEQTYMEGVIAGAAAEREECAKLCEWKTGLKPVDTAIETCAAAIRARSES